jgi:CheY-like chemotaxis protein
MDADVEMAMDRWSVLVVENDEAVRSTLLEGLRDAGLVVEGAVGAGSINGWRGDVIVTDTFASPYRTAEVAAYLTDLRSRYTAGLVVLSGHAKAATDAEQLPADAVVMKPYDLDHLVGVIARIARNRREPNAPSSNGR